MKNVIAIDFDELPFVYWKVSSKLTYLQRRILVYSIQYYEFNENCVSDRYYDACCIQLEQMLKTCDEEDLKQSKYYYVFYDFTAGTGFHLFSRLTKEDQKHLSCIAQTALSQWRKENEERQKEMIANGVAKIKGLEE